MNKNRSELTLFLLQLPAFLLPLGVIVPAFLSPGFTEIVLEPDIEEYLSNLLTGTYGLWSAFIVAGTGALILGLLRLIFQKAVTKHCKTKNTLLAFAVGSFGAAGLYCFATFVIGTFTGGDLHRHPLQISWGLGLGLLFFAAFILFAAWYLYLRIKEFSLPALPFDIATAIISFFTLMPLGSVAVGILSDLARFFEW